MHSCRLRQHQRGEQPVHVLAEALRVLRQTLLASWVTAEEAAEVEEEVSIMLAALALTFDPQAFYHQHNQWHAQVLCRFSALCTALALAGVPAHSARVCYDTVTVQ